VSRPSAEEVELALAMLADARIGDHRMRENATAILRAALEPRPVWPRKEVARELGVLPANLMDVRGLPEPAQELPRPTRSNPDNVLRLWYVDEIDEFARERRARKGNT
jgi:hypothetical protein